MYQILWTSINFPKDENVSDELLIKIGRDYLEANGFNQHQYIMFRHNDAGHPHFHILVNRIGYDGSVVSDSNDYARSEKVLRDLERKYNLTQVVSSKQAQERGMTKNEMEMVQRSNIPSHKMAMQVIIKLGNGFKWSTVKNIINYEQERDRQRILKSSVNRKFFPSRFET